MKKELPEDTPTNINLLERAKKRLDDLDQRGESRKERTLRNMQVKKHIYLISNEQDIDE